MGVMKTIASEAAFNPLLAGDSAEMKAMRRARRACLNRHRPERIEGEPTVTAQPSPNCEEPPF